MNIQIEYPLDLVSKEKKNWLNSKIYSSRIKKEERKREKSFFIEWVYFKEINKIDFDQEYVAET